MRIRPAQPRDAVVMARVHARSWPATYRGLVPDEVIAAVVAQEAVRAERFGALIANPASGRRGWVATDHGTVVGLAFSGPSRDQDAGPGTAEIDAIYLDPDYVRRGIGRRLMAAVTADLHSRGFTIATLWVLDTNEAARSFYAALGWRPDGSTKSEPRPGGILEEVRYARALTGD
jgi:ribosomal protein S18 acetylase RimI-like enzyme